MGFKIVSFLEKELKFAAESCMEFKDKAVFEYLADNPEWGKMSVNEKTEFNRGSKKVGYTVRVTGERK